MMEQPLMGYFVLAVSLVGTGMLIFGVSLWAYAERRRLKNMVRAAQAEKAQNVDALFLRNALFKHGHEGIVVWDSRRGMEHPISFSGGQKLFEECLASPEAETLAEAHARLIERGASFSLPIRLDDGRSVMVRGRPIGIYAALFLDAETEEHEAFRKALEAIPAPVWIRDRKMMLRWANSAFLKAVGGLSLAKARSENVTFDGTERRVATVARASGEAAESNITAAVAGVRPALSFTLSPLADGGMLGIARALASEKSESLLMRALSEQEDALESLSTAVAMFDAGQKLFYYNSALAKLWGLGDAWLETKPTLGQMLDRLRELRRLPEQQDFAAWKRGRIEAFVSARRRNEEMWFAPDGRAIRVAAEPRSSGGLLMMFDDVTHLIKLESSFNTLMKVQQATLDTLSEGLAVFGPDGRMKLHNQAFSDQWDFTSTELAGQPHLKEIAANCQARFGPDSTWDIVMAGINSPTPEQSDIWSRFERADGTILSLALTRLPDGSTLASFTDVTDFLRLQNAVDEKPLAKAGKH